MPRILTRQFGVLEFDSSSILEFPEGLPGFPDKLRFALVEQAPVSPIVFLQSLSDGDLCFLAVPVTVIDPGYQLAILPEDLRLLGFDDRRQPHVGREALCLAILSATEKHPTANLLAPVVVNLANQRAVQAVRADALYRHNHPLHGEELCS